MKRTSNCSSVESTILLGYRHKDTFFQTVPLDLMNCRREGVALEHEKSVLGYPPCVLCHVWEVKGMVVLCVIASVVSYN